jgi:glycosyltransferase involved in cell wall biosynthesis
LPDGVGYREVRGPRRAVHLAWTAFGRPRLDQMVGSFDLLHALQPSFPLPTDRPGVLTVHDVMTLQQPQWHPRVERWGFRRAVESAVERGWMFMADSAYSADAAVEMLGVPRERITVVHLGLSDDFRGTPAPEAVAAAVRRHGAEPNKYILSVGVSARKNVLVLVRALAASTCREVRLLLAGRCRAEDRVLIEAECDRLQLGDRVRILGFVADDDLRLLFRGARVVAHASVDEGFGFPPLEGMAAGSAVVAADAGSLPEIVGDAAVLVDPTDVDGWASAFSTLCEDDDRHQQLVVAGRDRAAEFTWAQTAAKTVEVYQRVLASADR